MIVNIILPGNKKFNKSLITSLKSRLKPTKNKAKIPKQLQVIIANIK